MFSGNLYLQSFTKYLLLIYAMKVNILNFMRYFQILIFKKKVGP